MEKLSVVLKRLRESRNMTIEELAKKSSLGKGTVGDIETGKSKSTVKTLNKLSETLDLTKEEKNQLDSAFLGRKISFVQDPRVNTLSRRNRINLEELLEESALFFNDEKITLDDKKKLFDSLVEIYFKNKEQAR